MIMSALAVMASLGHMPGEIRLSIGQQDCILSIGEPDEVLKYPAVIRPMADTETLKSLKHFGTISVYEADKNGYLGGNGMAAFRTFKMDIPTQGKAFFDRSTWDHRIPRAKGQSAILRAEFINPVVTMPENGRYFYLYGFASERAYWRGL